jgi:hypothetical protein
MKVLGTYTYFDLSATKVRRTLQGQALHIKFLEITQLNFLCEITAFIAGICVLCCFTSEFTKKINKIKYKTDKNTNIFIMFL